MPKAKAASRRTARRAPARSIGADRPRARGVRELPSGELASARTRGRRVRCKDEMDSSPDVSGIMVPASVGVMQTPKGGVRESSYDYRRGSVQERFRSGRIVQARPRRGAGPPLGQPDDAVFLPAAAGDRAVGGLRLFAPLGKAAGESGPSGSASASPTRAPRSEEHTSELQSPVHLVCRLLLEKKN